MPIDYKVNVPISTDQFIDVLNRSTLGQRRPIDDRECMEAMVKHANLVVTAWDTDTTVPHVPADPRDIMAALLRTPPPPAGDPSTRKRPASKRSKKAKKG